MSIKIDHLKDFTNDQITKHNVPGCAVGIIHQGQAAVIGLGETNVEHPLPVDGRTLFQIGSISKTYAATLVMMLVQSGRLDLDKPLTDYIPDFRVADDDASQKATLRHVLTHSAGWTGDHFVDTGFGDDAMAKYVAGMAELPQLAPIGTVWSYCNTGFYLIAHVLERVTGRSYADLIKETLFDPVGLAMTFFAPGDVMTHRLAVGHVRCAKSPEVARPWLKPRFGFAGGGITASMDDLLTYARFQLDRGVTKAGQTLLSPETWQEMHSPHFPVYGEEHWGLGWSVDDGHGARLTAHGGATVGYMSQLTLVPERGFAVAVLTNGDTGRQVTRAAAKFALKEFLGLEAGKPAAQPDRTDGLAELAGLYRRPAADMKVDRTDQGLKVTYITTAAYPTKDSPLPPPITDIPLAWCGPDRLIAVSGPLTDETAEVIRRDDGSVGWIRFRHRLHIKED